MKIKGLKKVVSGLVATIMATSCFITSVGAEGDKDIDKVKVEFSLNYLNSLPKEGEADLNKFLDIPPEYKKDSDSYSLSSNREEPVKHPDGTIDYVPINEEKVYSQIQEKVKEIKQNVDDGTFEKGITDENQKNEYNKMSKDMKIAGAIYEWVSKEIEYDKESTEKDNNGAKSFRKPQDVFFVYSQNKGICLGKSQLITLMMRLSGIPSATVNTDGTNHTYNAVYLKQEDTADRTGWILLDSSHAGGEYLRKCFPAFYDFKCSIKDNNENIFKLGQHHDIWFLTGVNTEQRYYFTINGVSYTPAYGYNLKTSYFEVFNSDWNNQNKINVKNYTIPSFISKLGMSLQIGTGIESINVKDNKEAASLDVSVAYDLKSINKDGSNKYVFIAGMILDKKRKAGMILDKETKEVISASSKWEAMIGQTKQGVWYDIYLDYSGTKVNRIVLGAYGDPEAKDVKVPEYLTQLNAPIEIQSNIKSLILEGDEILNLHRAYGLESIDIKNSTRYEIKNGGVFDKKLNTMLSAPISGKRVNVLA